MSKRATGYVNGYMKLPDGRIRVRFQLEGKVFKGTFKNMSQAKNWRRVIEDRYLLIKLGLQPLDQQSPRISLYTLLDKYLKSLIAEGRPEKTIRDVESTIRNLKSFFQKDFDATRLDTPLVREYFSARLNNPRGPRTTKGVSIKNDLTYLKAAYNKFEVERNWKKPRELLKRIPKRSRRVLSYDETKRFLSALPSDSPMKAYCEFLVFTGCRPIEARNLRWSDIHFENRTVTIRLTKVSREKTVSLPHVGIESLLRWKNSPQRIRSIDDHVFTFQGRPLTQYSFRRQFTFTCQRAGIEPPITGPGTFRHSNIAITKDIGGLPLEVVSLATGHADTSMTRTYYTLSENDASRIHADKIDQLYK